MLRLIPGLEQAEFVRFGMVHRNTYINGPTVLRETWQVRTRPTLFFAGQMSGVEGYVESAASGLLAGLNAAALATGEPRRRRRGRRRSARWRTMCRTPIRRTTSRRTSRSASCRRSSRRAARARSCATKRCRRARAAPISIAGAGHSRGIGSHGRTARKRSCGSSRLTATRRRTRSRAYESDLSQFLDYVAAQAGLQGRDARADAARSRRAPRLPRRAARAAGSRARRRRASSPPCARSCAICAAKALIDDDPGALVATPKRDIRMPAHLSERRDDRARSTRRPATRRWRGATARSSSCSMRRACA